MTFPDFADRSSLMLSGHWTVADAESEITATSGCDEVTVTADTAGVSFTCTASSTGGTDSATVTIKRDATPPTVTYTGNNGTYSVDQTVLIDCTADDNLSGVASTTCEQISGPAYSFAVGANTFSDTATDHAGNTGSGSTTFTVSVDAAGMCALVEQFVSNKGTANSLCQKLDAAEVASQRGNLKAKDGIIRAFVREVEALPAKFIAQADSDLLTRLVQEL